MPELPEVETTVRGLRKHVLGLAITDLWTDWPKIAKHPLDIQELSSRIRNKNILDVQRRAKYIVMTLEGSQKLYVHQKMSGHLLYGTWEQKEGSWVSTQEGALKDDPKNKYVRLLFSLSNGAQVALADQRRFATLTLLSDQEPDAVPAISALGPEPLDLSLKNFIALFHTKRGKIKPVLMDPSFIAGIGNIYADEILWDAGIHPLTNVAQCTPEDFERVYRSMQTILQKAIQYQGSSMDDYRLPNGDKGRFQDMRKAYHRHGNSCERGDGGIIERIKVGQRSTHFCPRHQLLL